jgi:hypothetical protein
MEEQNWQNNHTLAETETDWQHDYRRDKQTGNMTTGEINRLAT